MAADVKRKAALILNPAAGRGADADTLREGLSARFELTVHELAPGRDAGACTREALETGAEVVIAAGGDGTVSTVAGALVGSSAVLGVVPRGTSNSIAASLGIPDDERGAVETISDGEVRTIDSARANGRTMLLHAGAGFHAAMIGDTERDAKQRWGVLAYVKEGLAKLASLEQFQVRIETEDHVVSCRAVNVMVANAAPAKTLLAQGPAEVVPDDGRLDITIVAASSLAEAVATGLHLLSTAAFQEPATRDNVGYLSGRRVVIETDPPQPLLIDGEPAGEGRLVVECLSKSVRVLVPAGAVAEAAPPAAAPDAKLEGLPDLEIDPNPT